MRTAIVGAGGQGGILGGLLARAGGEVYLIDRAAHLAAIRAHGLRLVPEEGEPFLVDVPGFEDPASVGICELVLLCVKTYDLEDALSNIDPLVGPSTTVLTIQNGIDAPGIAAEVLGGDKVLAGVSYLPGRIESPGTVRFGGMDGQLLVGEFRKKGGSRPERVASLLSGAGIPCRACADIATALWEKMVLICATGGVMAVMRLPMGAVLESTGGADLLRGVMEEAAEVAKALGIELPDRLVDRHMDLLLHRMAPTTRSSQLEDLLQGRPLELESLNGAIVRMGNEVDTATPLNFAIYASLLPYLHGPPSSG